ncbi:hypothetical protein O181_050456 [Austropuccinia psidii MF-1]|uniref:Uncharacterized protein n=1 Tax=Austropuccinia psidii MF-1 TaxID=1389203 RepID=A0A9Q3E1U6_9BASI|nr:hypothetical protein [Austropuccinia psidii MF-1]
MLETLRYLLQEISTGRIKNFYFLLPIIGLRRIKVIQGGPSQLKIPERKRTDGSRTEGEDSVSSVSLELISGFFGRKRVKESDMNIKLLRAMLNYGPPQSPQYGSIRKGGPPLHPYGSGLVSTIQAIWTKLTTNIIPGPLVTLSKMVPRELQLPPHITHHGLWTTVCRLWAIKIKIDQNGQNFKTQERFHDMKRTKMTSKGYLGPRTLRFMGTRPLLNVHMEEFGARKRLNQ